MDATTTGALISGSVAILGGGLKLWKELAKLKIDASLAREAGSSASQDRQAENFWRFVEQLQEERNWWKEQAEHALGKASELQVEMNKLETQQGILNAQYEKALEEIKMLRDEIRALKGMNQQ